MPAAASDRSERGLPDRVGLIALDLDGTALSPNGHVSPRTRSAIRGVIDAGIPVCIATGRSWWESKGCIAEADFAGPGVFAGGAIVSDVLSGATRAHTLMHADVARDICRHLDEAGVAAMVLQDRSHADVEFLIAEEYDMPPTVPEWLARHGSSYRRVPKLWLDEHRCTARVGTVTSARNESEALAAHLAKTMGERIYQHLITVSSTGSTVLEVFDSTVNKWRGIQQVAALLKIDDRSIVAIGDDANDLQMLRHARVGVAMGNAREEIQSAADRVIGTNAEDGLAHFLESLVADGGSLTSAQTVGKRSELRR